MTFGVSAIASMTSSVNAAGCGLVKRTRSRPSISPHARTGQVRALGVSGEHRSAGFPDIPTVAEAGVPGYAAPTWSGLIGPAGMPRPVLDKLNAAVNLALQTNAFKERFAVIGDELGGGTPEDFGKTIKDDLAKWKDVVQRSGAKLE